MALELKGDEMIGEPTGAMQEQEAVAPAEVVGPEAIEEPKASTPLLHECPECGQGFSGRSGLGRHRAKAHGWVSPTAKYRKKAKRKHKKRTPRTAPKEAGGFSPIVEVFRQVAVEVQGHAQLGAAFTEGLSILAKAVHELRKVGIQNRSEIRKLKKMLAARRDARKHFD